MSKKRAVRLRAPALVLAALLANTAGWAAVPSRAFAALPASAETAVMSYSVELERVEHSKGRVSLEPLFQMAYVLRDELMHPAGGGDSPLESLSEEEFAAMKSRLQGMAVTREEAVFVVPDGAFFEKLGERKGRTEDRLLLRLYRRTYPVSTWPVYVRKQTDYSGCTDFGPGNLTKLYGEWSRYRTTHPERYRTVVEAELGKIVDELTKSDCACGPSGSVQSELRYFVHRHPGSPILPQVRDRLNELLHGKSKIRFNCISG